MQHSQVSGIGRPAFNRTFSNAVTSPMPEPAIPAPAQRVPMHVKRVTLTSKKNWWMGEQKNHKSWCPVLTRLYLQWKWMKKSKVIQSTHSRLRRRLSWTPRIITITVWIPSTILISNAKSRLSLHHPQSITLRATQRRYFHSLLLLPTLLLRIQRQASHLARGVLLLNYSSVS